MHYSGRINHETGDKLQVKTLFFNDKNHQKNGLIRCVYKGIINVLMKPFLSLCIHSLMDCSKPEFVMLQQCPLTLNAKNNLSMSYHLFNIYNKCIYCQLCDVIK